MDTSITISVEETALISAFDDDRSDAESVIMDYKDGLADVHSTLNSIAQDF